MFCALVSIIVLLSILIGGVTISAVDIEDYNFGLYYALLAIVGLMIACAVCVVRPPSCKNPKWYDRCCLRLADYLAPEAEKRRRYDTNRHKDTLVMLGPAVQLMHHMIHGLAATDSSNSETGDNLYTILEVSSVSETCTTDAPNVLVHNLRQKIPETIPEEPTVTNSHSTMSIDR